METSMKVVEFALRPFPAVAALDHVATSISSFLDRSVMIPLDQACAVGSTRLLDRIWHNSDPEADRGAAWSLCNYLRSEVHYYQFQFSKSLRAAVTRGELEIVQWVLEHFSACTAGEEVVEQAARCGRLEILQYLLEYGRRGQCDDETVNVVTWGGEDIVNAIEAGHGEVARWLYENTSDAERDWSRAMGFAARQGDMSLVQWLLDGIYKTELHLPPPLMNDAAAGGHMEMLQWIFQQGYGGCSDRALEGAARNGRLDMVKWLVEHGILKGGREAMQVACGEGHLSIVQWILKRKWVQYLQFAMNCAVRSGHLDIVHYMCEAGVGMEPSRMMVEAASSGQLGVVQWLHDKFGSATLFPAVDSSRRGCSRHTAMDRAASNGHLNVLEFLHSIEMSMQSRGESGGPTCSEWALTSACAMDHFEVAKWIYSKYPCFRFPPSTTSMVARNGNLEILQWLHHQPNIEWSTDTMDSAAENGHLAVVRWLHKNRTEGCTTNAMNYAARDGHFAVVKWLHIHRTEGCTTDAMDFAVDREHFEVLLFLRAHKEEGCSASATLFAREHRQRHIREWLEEYFPDV
ncbi:unnamed protein product [Phytophthora lilii]|uniref:Unnamed protein product n=1 Tax=Phytophthora lilii TaxID=2077276 RepID=A0A9W6WPL1_9STRA|nr:unnamed protein product [Phytophthora lilii]